MQKATGITAFATAIFFILTLVFGVIGWMEMHKAQQDYSFLDALYHSLLALVGDASYITGDFDGLDPVSHKVTLNLWIEFSRFTGIFTTISAILVLTILILKEQIAFLVASLRANHVVIIGASEFVLREFQTNRITLFAESDASFNPGPLPARSLLFSGPINKYSATGTPLGRPKTVVFGDRNTVSNVERAQVWLSQMRAMKKEPSEIILRVEDGTVAKDLQLLSDGFRNVTLISRSETIARGLITSVAPNELALRRGQENVHLVLVGLGSINLAIAEQAALRCHHIALKPLRLTVVDLDIDNAEQKLRRERPDLLATGQHGIAIQFVSLDALECCAEGAADGLVSIEAKHPITAVIVATGNDTRNTEVAMRLRQFQIERLRLKAPIYMRSDAIARVSAAKTTDLTGGIVPFGGSASDDEDVELDRLYHVLAETIHNRWREASTVTKSEDNKWENLSNSERRSSYRAALSAIEIFYAAGFVPPVDFNLADLRLEATAANAALGNDDLVFKLSEMEHNRWIVERTLEGFRSTNGYRDDERKLHPLMVPYELLPKSEEIKDEKNIKETINFGIGQSEATPTKDCWRALVRIGVIGPLSVDEALIKSSISGLIEDMLRTLRGLSASSLEIITPNAPGFDRIGAVALANGWKKHTGRPARVLILNAAGTTVVDQIAAESIAETENENPSLIEKLRSQTKTLDSLVDDGHYVMKMDCRPLGKSDADMIANRDLYFQGVQDLQSHIFSLADHMIFNRVSSAEWTNAAIDEWAKNEKSEPLII